MAKRPAYSPITISPRRLKTRAKSGCIFARAPSQHQQMEPLAGLKPARTLMQRDVGLEDDTAAAARYEVLHLPAERQTA